MAEPIVLVSGGVRWQIQPGLEPLFGPDGLRLDEWLAAGQAHVIKHGPHRTVYHVVLPGVDFYLKHNRLADRRAWLRQLVRPSKARSEYEHARWPWPRVKCRRWSRWPSVRYAAERDRAVASSSRARCRKRGRSTLSSKARSPNGRRCAAPLASTPGRGAGATARASTTPASRIMTSIPAICCCASTRTIGPNFSSLIYMRSVLALRCPGALDVRTSSSSIAGSLSARSAPTVCAAGSVIALRRTFSLRNMNPEDRQAIWSAGRWSQTCVSGAVLMAVVGA